jgi:hypothetical protein
VPVRSSGIESDDAFLVSRGTSGLEEHHFGAIEWVRSIPNGLVVSHRKAFGSLNPKRGRPFDDEAAESAASGGHLRGDFVGFYPIREVFRSVPRLGVRVVCRDEPSIVFGVDANWMPWRDPTPSW